MKNILIGLIPALMWGVQPLIMTKLGGSSNRKLLGMSLGILVSALLISIFKKPSGLDGYIVVLAFIDGLALSYGLINQIRGLELLGVSKGSPISTAGQLVFSSLMAAFYFKEWTRGYQYLLGFSAILLIILGAGLTSYREEKEEVESLGKGLITMVLSSLGFLAYTVILKIARIDIWDALIPQALGMLLGSYFLARRRDSDKLFVKESFRHILTGFFFAMGNISLMISNSLNGLALGFTLTHMSVVIASLGAIFFLGESRSKKELKLSLLGLGLVLLGGIMTGLTKI